MMNLMNRLGLSAAALMVNSSGAMGGDGLACTGVGVEMFESVILPDQQHRRLIAKDGLTFREFSSSTTSGFYVRGGEILQGTGVHFDGFVSATMNNGYAFATGDQSQLISYEIVDSRTVVELAAIDAGSVLQDILVDDGVLVGQSDALSLNLVDVSDPMNPVAAGSLPSIGQIRAFHLESGLLSVATRNDEILFFDVTDPYAPTQIAVLQDIDVETNHILEFENGWLFSGDDQALIIIDVSVPSAPVVAAVIRYEDLVDGFNIDPRTLRAMDADEGMLAMAFGSGGGFAFDLSNPTNPQLVAQYDTSSLEAGVAIDQGQLVLLASQGYVYKSDIDALNAANPHVPAGELQNSFAGYDIDVVGDQLFASGYGYSVYDISDLSKAVRTERYQFQSEIVYSAAQYQGYSYLAAGSVGLVVIDHSRPEGDREILRYNPLQSVVAVHRDGRDLLIVDESGTMIMMDLTFPQAPQIISVASIPYVLERRTIIFEDRMVYAISNEVDHAVAYGFILDWQQPLQPLLSVEHLEHKYSAMAKGDQDLYAVGYMPQDIVVAGTEAPNGVGILDITDLREQVFEEFDRNLRSVQVLPDQRVLVGDDAGQFMLLDQYSSDEILGVTHVGSVYDNEVHSITVSADLAFVGMRITGMSVVDVSDACAVCPADLDGSGQVDFFDVAAFIAAYGELDPVADMNGDGQWNFYDISQFLTMVQNDCQAPVL